MSSTTATDRHSPHVPERLQNELQEDNLFLSNQSSLSLSRADHQSTPHCIVLSVAVPQIALPRLQTRLFGNAAQTARASCTSCSTDDELSRSMVQKHHFRSATQRTHFSAAWEVRRAPSRRRRPPPRQCVAVPRYGRSRLSYQLPPQGLKMRW